VPITALVDQLYANVQTQGGGREDTSALIRHLPRKGGK
jgi:3-hydroxyisobutyrate dehydrogenase